MKKPGAVLCSGTAINKAMAMLKQILESLERLERIVARLEKET